MEITIKRWYSRALLVADLLHANLAKPASITAVKLQPISEPVIDTTVQDHALAHKHDCTLFAHNVGKSYVYLTHTLNDDIVSSPDFPRKWYFHVSAFSCMSLT